MSVILYEHQQKLKDEAREAFSRVKSVLMQGATGIGKTNISVSIIKDALSRK
jgi:superfamily II DNA or RNA helicase